jgi:plasmid stabilization system protein ParE
LSPLAATDLKEILSYRKRYEGSRRAAKVKNTLQKAILELAMDGERWPLIDDALLNLPVRRVVLNRTYSVTYFIEAGTITILRVWHNARNPEEQ